ncbi:MAG: trypsin-like peptidase domain-containing protein [Deltaproteobacteria bacterium]|nr:trypsin-like peptidase domain-containing protein [Deltaproteobacteria bacterium]
MASLDPTPQPGGSHVPSLGASRPNTRRRAALGVLVLAGSLAVIAASVAVAQQGTATPTPPGPPAARAATTVPTPATPPATVAPQPAQPPATPAAPTPARTDADSAIDFADRLSTAFSAVAERVSPSVVSIRVEAGASSTRAPRGGGSIPGLPFPMPFPFGDGGPGAGPESGHVRVGGGSGVVITQDGNILTNAHVVADAERVDVRLQDDRTFRAEIVGVDRATDLAVLRIPATGLTPARFAQGNRPARAGEWVVAIGSPFGLDYTVTAGIVSATGRGGLGQVPIEDFVQTDARINPGNSGGPLVNLRGEVVGINTMILGRDSGIGFAVSAPIATHVASQLQAHGRVARSFVGVGFQPLTPELANGFGISGRRGALVSSVSPGMPAARAGIRPGDVITAVNGILVTEDRDFLREVMRAPVGSRLALDVIRDGRPLRVEVVTVERTDLPGNPVRAPDPSAAIRRNVQQGSFGLAIAEMSPLLAQQLGDAASEGGVVITDVENGSPADRAGLRRGDVVVEADRRTTRTTSDLLSAIGDGSALLRVRRGEGSLYTILRRD